MPRKEYNKLVRDLIPDIIAKNGGVAKVSQVSAVEFRVLLYKKLLEEMHELVDAGKPDEVLEEMADIVEVLAALARDYGYSMATVEAKRWQKRTERGGFDKRLLLEYVDED